MGRCLALSLAAAALGVVFCAGEAVGRGPKTLPAGSPQSRPAGRAPSPAGLVAFWSGDGSLRDALGRHHGKAVGSVAYTADRHGNPKGALLLNGRDAFIRVADDDALDTDDAFTVSAWIKPAAYKDHSGHESVVACKYVHHLKRRGDWALMFRSGGALAFMVANGDTQWTGQALITKSTIPKGKWTHLAATFGRGYMEVYVNGIPDASMAGRRVTNTSRKEYADDDVCIGALPTNQHNFRGALDGVSLWNRALSGQEIRSVFSSRGFPDVTGPVLTPRVTRERIADRVVLRDGAVLKGSITNAAHVVRACFGEVAVPAKRVAAMAPAAEGKRMCLLLTDGQVVVGALAAKTLQLELAGGSVLTIPPGRILECGYRICEAKPALSPTDAPMVHLRSGDRLRWVPGGPAIRLASPYGEFDLPMKRVLRIDAADLEGRVHRVQFVNGSVISGTLKPQVIRLRAELAGSLRTTREAIHSLTCPARRPVPLGPATVITRGGERLHGEVTSKSLTIRTPYGDARVQPAGVLSAEFKVGRPGAVTARLWGGTVLIGRLVEPTLGFRIGADGPILKLPVERILSITRRHALPPAKVVREIEELIARLGSDSYQEREAATRNLIGVGKVIAPLLRSHLRSDDPEIRHRIGIILQKLGVGVSDKK